MFHFIFVGRILYTIAIRNREVESSFFELHPSSVPQFRTLHWSKSYDLVTFFVGFFWEISVDWTNVFFSMERWSQRGRSGKVWKKLEALKLTRIFFGLVDTTIAPQVICYRPTWLRGIWKKIPNQCKSVASVECFAPQKIGMGFVTGFTLPKTNMFPEK